MFGIEVIRDDGNADRATVTLDNLEDALRIAKELTESVEHSSHKVRVIDKQGVALGIYYASSDRFVPDSEAG
ncbi:MAG: hypothetical protein NVS3B5_14100 [Sphingomicrobium sp.]